MQNFVSVLAICALVLLLYIGVFQGTVSENVDNQGTEVGDTLDAIDSQDTSNIGSSSLSGS